MTGSRPTFDDMRVEVCGCEVRLVFLADSEEHAQRIARDVAAKIKAERPASSKRSEDGFQPIINMGKFKWPIRPARSPK